MSKQKETWEQIAEDFHNDRPVSQSATNGGRELSNQYSGSPWSMETLFSLLLQRLDKAESDEAPYETAFNNLCVKMEIDIAEGLNVREEKLAHALDGTPTDTELEAEVKRLRKAVLMTPEPTCHDLHHKKAHRHEHDEPCPVVAEYLELTK